MPLLALLAIMLRFECMHLFGFRCFGNNYYHVIYIPVVSVIPTLIEKLKDGYDLDILKTLSVFNTLSIASPFGIPINLNMTNHAILKLTGRVKVNNMPRWSDVYNRRPFDNVELDIDLKPT